MLDAEGRGAGRAATELATQRATSSQCATYRDHETPPFVIFVCQDEEKRGRCIDAATGHHWHAIKARQQAHYVGRRRMLFAVDSEMHGGDTIALASRLFLPSAGVEAPQRIPTASGFLSRSGRTGRPWEPQLLRLRARGPR